MFRFILSSIILTSIAAVLPPFFLGKPDKDTFSNFRIKRIFDEHEINLIDNFPYLQTLNFSQKLDHFNPYNTKTWNQKYFYNPIYSRNNSIIFLMIGGEGPENGHWAVYPEVQYLQWAKEFGADVFDLEHRFFGDSWPQANMNTSTLQLLTTQQALADIAHFIESMNKKHNFNNPRWVTFGGSYPGSLSAWFRQKYPDLTVGSVAKYAMVVEDDLRLTDVSCASTVKKAFEEMQFLSLTIDGRKNLSLIFNLVPPFDENTTKLDVNNFFGNLFNVFQGMTQYTYDGQSNRTHSNMTVQKMCDIMIDPTEPNYVQRVKNLFQWYNFFNPASPDLSVMPNSYKDIIKQLSSGDLNTLGPDGAAARGWMWLCCNEIGFLQTTDQGSNVFGSTVPLSLFIDMCIDMFGSSSNTREIMRNNDNSQNYYGGADFYNATNIVLPNGSLDPWHALGSYNMHNQSSMLPYLINGTAHCSDMYPSYDSEPAALPAARAFIKENVKQFIQYNPKIDGPKSESSGKLLTCLILLLVFWND